MHAAMAPSSQVTVMALASLGTQKRLWMPVGVLIEERPLRHPEWSLTQRLRRKPR